MRRTRNIRKSGSDGLGMLPHMSDSTIAWEPWTPAAFARAAAERKPILLSLTASWCRGCDVMDAVTYADPRIASIVREAFVPLRVDTDRRPDVNARYNLDGWPTTALLTPGGEMLTGSTYLTPDAMLQMLEAAATAMRERYDELMARAEQAALLRRSQPPPPRYEPDGEAPAWLVSRMVDEEDREHGGFGAGGKFLSAEPVRLALAVAARQADERLTALIVRTLDAVCWRGLFDEVDGGFFRYAANRDFSRPHTEKLLEDQVALVPLLLDAARRTGRIGYHRRAGDVVRYVHRTLADPERGVFFASQQADEEYYASSGSIRRTLEPPPIDRTIFTDLNGQAIAAWFDAAPGLDGSGLDGVALRAVDRVILPAFVPGEGLRHWSAPDAPAGLLTDQVHGARALLGAATAAGRDDCLTLAAAIMAAAVERLWDARGGGFFDRAPGADDVGLLRDPRKPLALNSLAACVLRRLGDLTGDVRMRARARETLGSLTGRYRTEGLAAAPYAVAVLDVLGSPA